MLSRKALLRAGAVLVAATAVVSGCSNTSSGGSTSSSSSTTTTDIKAIKVSGKFGKTPEIDVPTPYSTDKTEREIISEGKGKKVEDGQRVSVDYVGINGADGEQFDSSYDGDSSAFTLEKGQVITGFVTGLTGVTVGSRVLITIPPDDAYGTSGVSSAGIGPTDTLIFVVDVHGAADVLKKATGTKVKVTKSGLPTVKLAKNGEPTITLPSGDAPDSLVVQPLIEGSGAKVEKGQNITVKYTGVVWPGGKVFDSTWTKDTSATFAIGSGQVITGWDKGLVGKTVGSQILLVIPPDEGYGVEGKEEAGIKGTDTLVFVVDILDATGTSS